MKTYNPEKRDWKGRSYRKGGEVVRDLKDSAKEELDSHKYQKPVQCPECWGTDVGEENTGEGYCYYCGHQWML